MIGKIIKALTPFYNSQTHRQDFKVRPALVIAKADNTDYVVLPVSKVSRQENIDPTYDVKVDPAYYPLLNLRVVSYVRTHKQTIVHGGEVGDVIGDLKGQYEDLYVDIMSKWESFSASIREQALQ